MVMKRETIINMLKKIEKIKVELGSPIGINSNIENITTVNIRYKIVDKEYSILVKEGIRETSPYFDSSECEAGNSVAIGNNTQSTQQSVAGFVPPICSVNV